MTLTLLAVSLNEQPLSQPITAIFDANGGTIGRADHNTMALPDPERHISRLQAEIIGTGSHYLIKNVGAANPIVVGSRTLAQGESTTLADRDQVRVGGYLLQVEVDSDDDPRGADITRGRAAIAATEPALRSNAWPRDPSPTPGPTPRAAPQQSIGGMSDIATPLSSSNPFADLMGGAPAPAPGMASLPPPAFARPSPGRSPGDTFADLMPGPAGIPRGSQALGSSSAAPSPARLPDDFDPFAPPPPRPDPLAPSPSRGGASSNPFDDLLPAAAPSSIDDVFGLRQPASNSDPLANFMAGLPPSAGPGGSGGAASAGGGGLAVDPMALFGSPPPPPPSSPSAANHTPDLLAGFVPPQVVSPPRPPVAPAPPPYSPQAAPPMPFTQAPPPFASAAPVPPAPDVANPSLPTMFDWQMSPPAAAPVGPPTPAPVPASPPVQVRAQQAVPRTMAPGPFGAPTPPAPVGALDLEFGFSPQAAPIAVPAPIAAAPFPTPEAGAGAGAVAPPTVPPNQADLQVLLQAFCAGAGIEASHMPALTPALMQDIGGVMRAAIEGTLQLIAVRATTKHELRAAVTVIQARGNNPLKFAPDASSGIEQLLRPTMRGFLAGPAAMTDAMNDLVGHSIGTVAGMRSALEGMLGRFAPQQLESKLVGQSFLDSVLPMNRKAKLWELYLQHFETIREEAQEDFHTLFGKAFLAAYEQQLERLKREGGGG
jgi:FHA domain-containing protein